MKIWDKEIVDYARHLMDMGLTDSQINLLIKEKYNKTASENVLLNWFMLGRREEDVPRGIYRSFELKYKDAEMFKRKIENIKDTAKEGNTITFTVKEYGDTPKPIKKKVRAKVIHTYSNFILTDYGTVNYQEVIEVI